MTLNEAPRWFYVVALTALLALLPMYIQTQNRITVLEERINHVAERDKEERRLFIQTMQKIDQSFEKLTEAVNSLKVEVSVIREKSNA